MTHTDDLAGEFVKDWLHSLCLHNVTTLNLGKDPWLRGLRGVTKYLEDKTKDMADEDPARQIYRSLFHPRGTGLYGALNAELSVTAQVKLEFVQGHGGTYYFPIYRCAGFGQSDVPGMPNLSDTLAKVFAKAYFNGSDNG